MIARFVALSAFYARAFIMFRVQGFMENIHRLRTIPADVRQISFSGYSMYPALRPGDTLVVRETPPRDIRVGDILCLRENGNYVSHRIVTLERDGNHLLVTTKGDNLTEYGRPEVIGYDTLLKVIMVKRPGKGMVKPRFGKALAFMSRNNLTYGIVKGKIGKFIKNRLNYND